MTWKKMSPEEQAEWDARFDRNTERLKQLILKGERELEERKARETAEAAHPRRIRRLIPFRWVGWS